MLTAVISEQACIGCNRCVAACPFDAIVGAAKHMHTVLIDECIGCKLCLDPCPVDCIDIVALPDNQLEKINKKTRALTAKDRYQKRISRLQKKANLRLPFFASNEEKSKQIKQEIFDAIQRSSSKARL
jgi:RnfABCDGE-type electron transport complex B subunit